MGSGVRQGFVSVEEGILGEPLLDAAEVAVLLGVPRSSVYEYARRTHNPLPSVPIGRHVRFVRSEVERWLIAQRQAVVAQPAARAEGSPQRRRRKRRR